MQYRGDAGGRPAVTRQRWRTARWVLLGLIAITAFAAVSAWLTTPRLGGRMDPRATSPTGAHALVALVRERGVEVIIADSVADVERAARPGTLMLLAQTYNARGGELMHRLAAAPGDRLVVEPTVAAREALAPGIRSVSDGTPGDEPKCTLREANRAGVSRMDGSAVYDRVDNAPLTRCYGGALVRYDDAGRTITVVGDSEFMTNAGLLKDGNAALAMNLVGTRDRVIWFAPQRIQGDATAGATITDLIPDAVTWVIAQLCLIVALVAVWQGRRLGPLVAEDLPVVVRASETAEGRARLYRSTRSRGQAAAALRTAALQRLTPRLGMGTGASDDAVITALAACCRAEAAEVHRVLFGPGPETDAELVHLAQTIDDIERQVDQS